LFGLDGCLWGVSESILNDTFGIADIIYYILCNNVNHFVDIGTCTLRHLIIETARKFLAKTPSSQRKSKLFVSDEVVKSKKVSP